MNIAKLIICYLIIISLTSSCTLTKRRYHNGFHVDWLSHSAPKKQKTRAIDAIESDTIWKYFQAVSIPLKLKESRIMEPQLFASDTSIPHLPLLHSKISSLQADEPDSNAKNDLIILTNGDSLSVHIIEVGDDKIIYEFLPVNTGPTFIRLTKDISKIVFTNGLEMTFKKAEQVHEYEFTNNFATASAVLGILSVPISLVFPPLGLLLALFAIIFGGIGLRNSRVLPNNQGATASKVGLILGISVWVLAILIFMLIILFFF